MNYEWDEEKRQSNRARHGVDFLEIERFDWEGAHVIASDREGETRFAALGIIAERLHFVVYTLREGNCRIISLRRASRKERDLYAGLH